MLDLYTAVGESELSWLGFKVARVVIYDPQGQLIADVRAGIVVSKDWASSEPGQAILAALKHGPLTVTELMERSGFRGGWFKTALTGLVASGRVVKQGRKYRLV